MCSFKSTTESNWSLSLARLCTSCSSLIPCVPPVFLVVFLLPFYLEICTATQLPHQNILQHSPIHQHLSLESRSPEDVNCWPLCWFITLPSSIKLWPSKKPSRNDSKVWVLIKEKRNKWGETYLSVLFQITFLSHPGLFYYLKNKTSAMWF